MLHVSNYWRKANQNCSEATSHSEQNGHHQNICKWMLERVRRKRNRPAWLVRMYNGAASMESNMMVPQKKKSRVTIWSGDPTLEHISGQNYDSERYMNLYIHTALFAVGRTWKQPKCPLMDEWIKKMWCVDTTPLPYTGMLLSHKEEQNNAVCGNMDGNRGHHAKWSKSERDKYRMISLMCEI